LDAAWLKGYRNVNNKSSVNSHDANLTKEDERLREILFAEKKKRELNQEKFAALLGIQPSYLSEILSGKKAGQRLAMQFLMNLDMLPDSEKKPNCPICNSNKNIKDLCMKVKVLIESKTHWGKSLEQNIISFKTGYDTEINSKNMDKVTSSGHDGGTPEGPARHTAKRQKAGSSTSGSLS
jgi:transcriptional regulator with XRE-family HTH domain